MKSFSSFYFLMKAPVGGGHAILLLTLLAGGLAAGTDAASLDRQGVLYSPFIEWKLETNRDHEGNPFDLQSTVTFTHPSGETRTTGMFYENGGTWKFRFTATRTGRWSFTTRSKVPALDGKKGTVTITAPPNAAKAPNGFMTSVNGNKWAWQTGEAGTPMPFVPQLVMGRDLPAYADAEKIDRDIQTWLVEHGFSGIHIGVLCRWFDFDEVSADEISDPDPNPDPRTFEVLEELITRFHRAGGMVHIWMWGDESRRMTPHKWGINGKADQRLHRYIAARLGPLPGWSMSYGFDLWEWVEGPELAAWHDYMHQHFGWPHFLGARWQKNELTQATEVLDYSSYEQHRPDYDKYLETIRKRPSKPSFSEDRYRVRDPSPYPDKDYDLELTRRGLWHSTMAGGVANIWGYLVPSADEGGSRPYPNREQIRTYARFFEGRFLSGMQPRNEVTDGVALAGKKNGSALILIYKEDADSIRLNLSNGPDRFSGFAVDTKKPYREISLKPLEAKDQVWEAPHASDWALVLKAAR